MKQFFLLELDVGPVQLTVQDAMEAADDGFSAVLPNLGIRVADGYELPEDTAKAVMAAMDNKYQEVS